MVTNLVISIVVVIVMIATIAIITIVIRKIKSSSGDLVLGGCLVELGGEVGEEEGGEEEGGEEEGETSVVFEYRGGIFLKSTAIERNLTTSSRRESSSYLYT